jgi:hypothetical protein
MKNSPEENKQNSENQSKPRDILSNAISVVKDGLKIIKSAGIEVTPVVDIGLATADILTQESDSTQTTTDIPTIEAQEEAQQIIEDYGHGKKDAVLSQSKAYQYRLEIEAVDAKKDKFQIKLARKEKGSTKEFKTLLTAFVHQGKVDSSHSMKESDKDVLLTLFKGASVHKLNESDITVLIPGFGKLILTHKGTVIFDEDDTTSLLSTYDLILNASGKLHIQSLAVTALTLDAKKSKISGIVTTNDLCINHDVVNLMGLRAHSITGTGTLINQGRLELEGTAENPAILGIHEIINEKNKNHDLDPKIESTHLHITSTNKGFINGEDALFSVTGKLHVDQSENKNLLNAGQMIIRDGEIHRDFINDAKGELTALEQLIVPMLLNQGDVEVKNLLKIKTCHNMGAIQGEIIDIEEEVTNNGQVSLHKLSGKGTFTNHRSLEFLGHGGTIGVYDFANETSMEKKRATVKGGLITISENNRKFANSINSDIFCNDLCSARPKKHILGDNRYQPIRNNGTIKTTSLTTDRWGFENFGVLETTSLTIPKGPFTNFFSGEMKVLGAITILSDEENILERILIDEGILRNEGNIWVKDLLGSGKFTNIPRKGKIHFTGSQQNPSLVEIKEFDGGFNHTQSFMCSLYETSLIWKNVNWTPGAFNEYILPLANTCWIFDNVTCANPLTIHNHGTIHLKNSTLTFAHLLNHGKMSISGGKYSIQNLSTTKHSNAGLIKFRDKACDFTVNTISHLGEIHVDPEIKQQIRVNSGTMTGKTIGKNLVLHIQKSVKNEGDVALWNLDGMGKFTNKGKLHFTGDQQNYSTIRIKEFENGSDDVDAQPAKIVGSHIVVNRLNKAFRTHDNSEIVAKKLSFTRAGDLLSKITLEFKGNIHTNELDINRDETVNLGVLETLIFSINGERFTNGSEALISERLTNGGSFDDKKGVLHVGSSLWSNVQVFDNAGEMAIDKGTFKQKSGRISNRGYWGQNGDINLGEAYLSNKQTGAITWKDGTLSLGTGLQKNDGDWILDGMASATKLALENEGSLHLKSGTLEFSSLINRKNLVLIAGEYTVDAFENHGLLSFLDNWTLIKDNLYFKLNPPNHQHLWFNSYQGEGEIECEKRLTMSLLPVMPKKIRAKEGVMAYRGVRLTLDDLMKIETPTITINSTSFCPGFTTLQNYQFTTIKKLNLSIDGPFSLNHILTAETINLDIRGKFSIGSSNASMGTLAATKGPLTVKAWDIDAKFGKIYGKGPTQLTATTGNLICGSPLQKSYDVEKNIGFAKEYCDPVQWKYAYTPVSDVNGAYIASDSNLDLNASINLVLSYGQIASQGETTFTAEYIEAVRSIIKGRGTSHWKAKRIIYIGREQERYLQLGWMSDGYPNEYMWAATSDETKIHFGGNIWFDTPSLTNLASTISSLEKIYIHYNGKDVNLSEEKPASVSLVSQSRKYYCHSPKIISGEVIEIITEHFTITTIMNSPHISIHAESGTFLNPSRSRATLNPTGPVVIDLTQFIQQLAQDGGFFNQLANGDIVTDFPFGVPSTPALNQILYLNDGKTPQEIVQQTGVISQHQNWQNPTNDFPILKPLGSLNLDSFIQMALAENAGKVHFKNEFGKKHSGVDLYKAGMGNSGKWIQKQNKNTATQDDLMAMTGVMLLLQLQQDAAGIRENLKLVIGSDEINPYQSPGDISGDKFLCHTDGDQVHLNNRIVVENDLEVTSEKGGIKRETQTYEEIHIEKHWSTHKIKTMPQQRFISRNGSVREIADGDIVDIGTDTEAGKDVSKESKKRDIFEETLVLPTTITTVTEEDNGPFGGTDTTTTTKLTHEFLQTTIKAGGKVNLKAKNNIDLEGSQHIADELLYWGLNYKKASVLVANKSSTTREESGMFSDKSTSIYQETPATAFAVAMANHIYNMCDTITVNGGLYQAKTLVDGSKDGGKYEPLVKEMKHHQQITANTPFSSLNAGQEGGQEVEIKPTFDVEKIIHQPKELVVLEDNSYREVEVILGTDNACGFIALQSHLGVVPEKARETAVKKILAALGYPQTQQIISNLIAPEIEDGAFGGEHQLGNLPGAQMILSEANLAEASQTKAMVMFRETFGQEETQGKTAEQLVESMQLAEDAPLASHRAYRKLQRTVEKVAEIEAKKKTWASKLETVKQFLFSVVAQPGWMLTNVPAYLKTPTGVMDALAFVLGLNVKVLTETDAKLSVTHAYEANPTWPTVELLHCEFLPNSGYKNHFNLLKKAESPKGMIFVNAEIDKQVTEIIGAYKEQFYALKKWNREWCEKTQVVPDAVLVVVAIAVVVLTKGMGASIVNGGMGATAATGTAAGVGTATVGATAGATAVTLSATQIAMANVAFSSLAAKVSTSLLKTGDPIACVKEVLSKENLLNWAITIASIGIAEKVGAFCEVNMGAGEKALAEHVQEQAIRNSSSLVVNTLAGQKLSEKIVAQTAVNTVFDAVSARVANNRGQMQREQSVHPVLHGVGHAIDAFGINYISAKVIGEKDPIKVARDRALGAFAAETLGGFLIEPGETNSKALEDAADISRIATAALGAALEFDVNDVDKGAMNALTNNFRTAAEEEDEEKKKKKTLIQYIYGEPDDADFVTPKATEMFRGQTVPKEDSQEYCTSKAPSNPRDILSDAISVVKDGVDSQPFKQAKNEQQKQRVQDKTPVPGHYFEYENISQSRCEDKGVDIGGGICAGVVTRMVLEDNKDDDSPFFTKETCQKAKNYQQEHERFSIFLPFPVNRTKNIFIRNGYDVKTKLFLDYDNILTQKNLDSYQNQVGQDGIKRSVVIMKKPFARLGGGHATFFSAQITPEGNLLCTGMDPNIARTRGYGKEGCERVKNFLYSEIQSHTGYDDFTILLIVKYPSVNEAHWNTAENFIIITNIATASLTSEALSIFRPIVSHTTGSFKDVQSILSNGIQLKSHPDNPYGGQAFYVAEGGLSINEVEGKHVITFKLSERTKIFDSLKGNWWKLGSDLAPIVRNSGFDAIKYEGSYTKANGVSGYNLAIVQNPQYLAPTGVYPVPSHPRQYTAISIPTIRGLQFLGAAGTSYALYHAGKQINNSSQPLVETAHQAGLFVAAVRGGAAFGTRAIIPCAKIGALNPPIAPYSVPICLASASLLGSFIAVTTAELGWQATFEIAGSSGIIPIKSVKNLDSNKFSCRVATTTDGARIAKCTIKPSGASQQSSERFFSSASNDQNLNPDNKKNLIQDQNIQAINDGTKRVYRDAKYSFFKEQNKIQEVTPEKSKHYQRDKIGDCSVKIG